MAHLVFISLHLRIITPMKRHVLPAFLFVMALLAITSASAQVALPLPVHQLAARIEARYQGRLVGAYPDRPTAREQALGASLVYDFRLITPQRNLLKIRLDARTGRFLEVAGQGQLQALRETKDRD